MISKMSSVAMPTVMVMGTLVLDTGMGTFSMRTVSPETEVRRRPEWSYLKQSAFPTVVT